jgi:hypothetical protein
MSYPLSPEKSAESASPDRRVSLNDGDLATPIPLNEFLNELGVLMQLPKSRTTVAMPVIVSEPTAPRRKGIMALAFAALLASGVLILRFSAPPVERRIPESLLGEWTTSHALYRERRLSFTTNRVGIQLRDGVMPALHPVRSVEHTGRGESPWYTITYEDDDSPVSFRVQYTSTPRPRLTLSNPSDVVWERVAKSASGER